MLSKRLIVFAIVLPLAVLLGYVLATPKEYTSFATIGVVVGVLLIPVLMRWHHLLLVLSWNAMIIVFFLPGQPSLWMVMALLSLGFSVLDRLLNKRDIGTHIPSIVWPLVLLSVVVVGTMLMTGGAGVRALGGGTFGGKGYFVILLGVVGYFALVGKRIPPGRSQLFLGLYLLSALTAVMSHVIYKLGPAFWDLYALFPVEYAIQQATVDLDTSGDSVLRITGLAVSGSAVCFYLIGRFGLKGLLNPSKAWRFGILSAALFATLLGGFRSSLLMLAIVGGIHFFMEGLHRTRWFAGLVITILMIGTVLVPTVSKLPMSIQRSLAFLPLDVNPQARQDAIVSTEWRLKMWSLLLPEVPNHLLVGKGLAINPTDMYLAQEAAKSGFLKDIDVAILSGSYHSGPLTLVLAFGIFGVIAFLWFGVASVNYLYKACLQSPPELRLVNTFIFAYFTMRLIYFVVFYGQFADDFFIFTGLVGLGVSINGRLQKETDLQTRPVTATPALAGAS